MVREPVLGKRALAFQDKAIATTLLSHSLWTKEIRCRKLTFTRDFAHIVPEKEAYLSIEGANFRINRHDRHQATWQAGRTKVSLLFI